jgi:hypothetical protein
MARHAFGLAATVGAPAGAPDPDAGPVAEARPVSPMVTPAGFDWLEAIRRANKFDTWGQAAESILSAVLRDPAGPAAIPRGLAALVPALPRCYGRARRAAAHPSRVAVRLGPDLRPALAAIARREGLSLSAAAAAILEDVRLDDMAGEGGR